MPSRRVASRACACLTSPLSRIPDIDTSARKPHHIALMAGAIRDQFTAFVANLHSASPTSEKPVPYDLGTQDTARKSWLMEKRPAYRAGIEFPSDPYHRYWLFHDFKRQGVPARVADLISAPPFMVSPPTSRVLSRPLSPPTLDTSYDNEIDHTSQQSSPLARPPSTTPEYSLGPSCPPFNALSQLQQTLPGSFTTQPALQGLDRDSVTQSLRKHLASKKRRASSEATEVRASKKADSLEPQSPAQGYGPHLYKPLGVTERALLPDEFKDYIGDDGFLDEKRLRRRIQGGVPCYKSGCQQRFNSYATATLHISKINKSTNPTVTQVGKLLGLQRGDALRLSGTCTAAPEAQLECTFSNVNSEDCALTDWDTVLAKWTAYVEQSKTSGKKKSLAVLTKDGILKILRLDLIRHQIAKSPGLPCRCGLTFGSLYYAALHQMVGCIGRPLTLMEWLNSFHVSRYRKLFSPVIYQPPDLANIIKEHPDRIHDHDIEEEAEEGNRDLGGVDEMDVEVAEETEAPITKSLALSLGTDEDQEFDDYMQCLPSGKLCIYPDRFSTGTPDSARKDSEFQWAQLASDHLDAFKLDCATVRLILSDTPSWSHPMLPGTAEFNAMADFMDPARCMIDPTGKRGLLAMTMPNDVYQSARATGFIFSALEARAPQHRIVVMCSDSWSCAAPNLAWACTVYDFKLHFGITDVDMESVLRDQGKIDRLRLALIGDKERYYGYDGKRHWVEVHSHSIAKVYAEVEEDELVSGFLQWCDAKQDSKGVIRGSIGRGTTIQKGQNALRISTFAQWDSMKERVREELIARDLL